jgi:phosphoenolpyruvate carboxylase
MYREWPFFRTVVDRVEMVLGKCDAGIARRYVRLAPPEVRPLWTTLRDELRLTRRWVKAVTGHVQLLEDNPSLQRSIRLRNPYVDPMSFLQVELLRRKRAGEPGGDRALLLTLNGIAAGLRNTG